eukprot:gb/GEZN01003180.1/.p1 GENE.gb/GEZN01003180.1/~~gb/GEZN01003180.1/.p1  ORF type:complete len:626 (+),score=61.13 gb/GEZN01003180.1/:146-2023(+)
MWTCFRGHLREALRDHRWATLVAFTTLSEPAGTSGRSTGARAFRVMSYNVLSPDVASNCAPWLMYLSEDTVSLVNKRIAEMAAEEARNAGRKEQALSGLSGVGQKEAGKSRTWKYGQDRVKQRTHTQGVLDAVPCAATSVSAVEEKQEKVSEKENKGNNAGPASRWKNWEGFKKQELYPHYIRHFHANHNPTWPELYSKPMRMVFAAPSIVTHRDLPPKVRDNLGVVENNVVEYTERRTGHAVQAATLIRLLKDKLGKDVGQQVYDDLRRIEDTVFRWQIRGPRVVQRILAEKPDIVGIQEYSGCDDETFLPFESVESITFRQSMTMQNFSGLVFQDPKGGDGLALFYSNERYTVAPLNGFSVDQAIGRAAAFNVSCARKDASLSEPIQPSRISNIAVLPSSLNTSGCLNLDMESKAHQGRVVRMLEPSSRRHFSLTRLWDRHRKKFLWVAVTHLQTSSRDNARTVVYPGEVRASELAFIRQVVAENVPSEDALVFLGDMNSEPTQKEVWSGRPCRPEDPSDCLRINTGFGCVSQEVCGMDWTGPNGKGSFMRDGFDSLHRWGDAAEQYPTSFTLLRSARIDYIFYSTNTLYVKAIPVQARPIKVVPHETEPSDHLPLVLDLDFT